MPSPVGIDPDSPTYDSIDEAAHGFTDKLGKGGKEHAGVLVQTPEGKYQYSTIIEGDRDSFQLAIKIPKGCKLAGIMHSHPGDDEISQVFSPGDVTTANQLKVPSYVLFSKDNSVRKYVPGVTQTRDMQLVGLHSSQKVAQGDSLQLPQPKPDQQLADQNTSQDQLSALQIFYPGK